jgi:hypothetical protein
MASVSQNFCSEFKYPDQMHYLDTFENALLFKTNKEKQKLKFGKFAFNSKTHGDFKKSYKKLLHKKAHVFIHWSVVEQDVAFIRKNNIQPDQDGLIHVERDGQKRTYICHEDHKKRLFPVSGDSTISLSGDKAHALTSLFFAQVQEEDLMKFLNKQLDNPEDKGVS